MAYKKITTPPCKVRWADLNTPNTRFATKDDPRGTYSVQCLLDPAEPEHKALLDELKAVWDAEYASCLRRENKKSVATHSFPWTDDTDSEGVETGLVVVRPKNKEYFTGKHGERVIVEIPIFDAKKNRITADVGNGSICRVNFEVSPFYTAAKFGLQLRLKAVQVLELVEYDPFGFGEVDGGYEGDPWEAPAEPPPPVEQVEVATGSASDPALAGTGTSFDFNADDELPFN